MKSGESLNIPFRVIITNPGVYHLNCLRFQIGVLSKQDENNFKNSEQQPLPPAFDEDELIPLQLSFTVTHVSNNQAENL